jgi:Right handed beta helix region
MPRSPILLISFALLAVLHGTSTSAPLPSKVWVAPWGSDTAACGTPTSPCATLQRAHDNVAPGGDVRLLTAGDYGGSRSPGLLITKAVSIIHEGEGEARILCGRDGPAVHINAGGDDIVNLRGLIIDGQGVASNGIEIRRASAVHVKDSIIRNFEGLGGGVGIFLMSSSRTQLMVSDTIIANNGSSGTSGGIAIRLLGTSASAKIVLEHVVLDKNVVGLSVDGTSSTGKGAHILIRNSLVSGNAAGGIFATSAAKKAPTFIILERSAAVNNVGTGILADGPHTTVLLRDSITTGNDTALSTLNGGQFLSFWQKTAEQPYLPVRQLQRNILAGASTDLPAFEAEEAAAGSSTRERAEVPFTQSREHAAVNSGTSQCFVKPDQGKLTRIIRKRQATQMTRSSASRKRVKIHRSHRSHPITRRASISFSAWSRSH